MLLHHYINFCMFEVESDGCIPVKESFQHVCELEEGFAAVTTSYPLSLFVSSKMTELADERRALKEAISRSAFAPYIITWLWENDAGARPEPIRSTYLAEVEACDLYIGLFWSGYGPYTIEEFDHARLHHKRCLIYEKRVDVDKRSPELTAFLKRVEQVENPEGLTVCWFTTPKELGEQVQKDVMRLLISTLRKKFSRPQAVGRSTGSAAIRERFELVNKLLACPTVQNSDSRYVVISLLDSQIANAIPRHAVSRIEVTNIVSTCLNYSSGMQEFIDIVGFFEGDSAPMQELRSFWENMNGKF